MYKYIHSELDWQFTCKPDVESTGSRIQLWFSTVFKAKIIKPSPVRDNAPPVTWKMKEVHIVYLRVQLH